MTDIEIKELRAALSLKEDADAASIIASAKTAHASIAIVATKESALDIAAKAKTAAEGEIVSLKAERDSLKLSDTAKALEITNLKASEAALKIEVNDFKTKPESKCFQLAAEICAGVGIDAIKLTPKGEDKVSNELTRAEWNKLTPRKQAEHINKGGKLID